MKKKLLNILMVAILVLAIPGTLMLASDISGALYKMDITVSNNGTLVNYVSTNGVISTPNLIAGGYLNSSANNVAVLDAAANDVPFMPGYLTNPWAFWVETIGADSFINYDLYTADTTGGLIAYFPADAGMLVSDNSTLEYASSFENNITGWFDTSDPNFTYPQIKRDATGIAVTDTSELSGIVYYDEPVELIPIAFNAWTDVDVSDYVPEHATGLVLHLANDAGVARELGARINGSVDVLKGDLNDHGWTITGIDGNDIVELFLEDANCHAYLVGFTGSDFTFKVAADDISLGVINVWTAIDLSTEAPNATGAIIVVRETGVGFADWGVRKNGSADVRVGQIQVNSISWAVIGSDASQVIEGNVSNLSIDFYLIGYTTGNVTFFTDGIDKSFVGGFGAWNDIDLSGDVTEFTTHIIFEIQNAGGPQDYGLRRKGSSENIVEASNSHFWAVVECDEDQVVEGWAIGANVDWWVIGYIEGYIDSPFASVVIADNVVPGEYTVTTSLNANQYDFSNYSGNTTVAVSMGGGLIPVFLLEEQELTAAAASVTFSNIDTLVANWDAYAGVTSRHLVLVVNAASPDAVAKRAVEIVINSDVGANYNHQTLTGEAGVDDADRQTGVNALFEYPGGTDYPFAVPGTTYADAFGGGTILFPHAFNTVNHKAVIAYGGAVEDYVSAVAGRWAVVDAITGFELALDTGNIAVGSTFWLGVVDERYLVEEELLVADGAVSFLNIPQDGSDLGVIGYPRSDRAGTADDILLLFNNDGVAGSYFIQILQGSGAGTVAATANDNVIGRTVGNNGTANAFGAFYASINQYAEATNDPHSIALSGFVENTVLDGMARVISHRRNNIVPVTRVDVVPGIGVDWKAGTLFSLYRVPRTVIERVELTAPAATITFTDIPQGYSALQLIVYARTDRAAFTWDQLSIEYNGDAVAANYDTQKLEGAGAVVTAIRGANRNWFDYISGDGAGANEFGGGIVTLPNYAKSDRHKHGIALFGAQEDLVAITSARWEDTDAINQIILSPKNGANFLAGSVFELVGVFPQDVHAIEVDGSLYGIADGNNLTVPDLGTDWQYVTRDSVPYMYSANTRGAVTHFTGSGTSNLDMGALHNASPELWYSFWFNLDTKFSSIYPHDLYLHGKFQGGADLIYIWLSGATGDLRFRNRTGGVTHYTLVSTETEWEANTWYNVIASISSTNGARLIVNNGVAITDVDTNAPPNGGNLVFASPFVGTRQGVIGQMGNIAVGTDNLTTDEETGLFNGIIPADANNIWYADEGTGVNIIDYGTDGNDGTAGAAVTWVGSGSIIRASWEWEYAATFADTEGGATDATPSFRTSSSDPDVVATAVSFQPVEEAKAPPWSLSEETATWITAANISGNFTTTPTPTYPGASVIEDIAAASGTPAQLPFLVIYSFVILAISLSISGVMRTHGSRSLLVKTIIVGGMFGIGEAVGIIDFWMVLFFLLLALAIMAASKPGEVT